MIDSTNPRIMANNIRELAQASGGTTVEANPDGASTAELVKLGVDETIYSIPKVTGYSTTETDTGKKWYDNSSIYSKTFTNITITLAEDAGTYVDTGISKGDIDTIVNAFAIDVYNQYYPVQLTFISTTGNLGIYTKVLSDRTFKTICIEYTKVAVASTRSTKKK